MRSSRWDAPLIHVYIRSVTWGTDKISNQLAVSESKTIDSAIETSQTTTMLICTLQYRKMWCVYVTTDRQKGLGSLLFALR